MSFTTLLTEQRRHALWVTLNRPDSLNAMNAALVDELRELFGGLGERREVRLVVLRGAGRAFCAGLDLKENTGAVDGGDDRLRRPPHQHHQLADPAL